MASFAVELRDVGKRLGSEVALTMRLIEAPANQDEYAAAWNEVLAAS